MKFLFRSELTWTSILLVVKTSAVVSIWNSQTLSISPNG